MCVQVAAAKGAHLSYALDTKGPEIRTAMLRNGRDIMLKEGVLVGLAAG
jgi:pyruvate kinase